MIQTRRWLAAWLHPITHYHRSSPFKMCCLTCKSSVAVMCHYIRHMQEGPFIRFLLSRVWWGAGACPSSHQRGRSTPWTAHQSITGHAHTRVHIHIYIHTHRVGSKGNLGSPIKLMCMFLDWEETGALGEMQGLWKSHVMSVRLFFGIILDYQNFNNSVVLCSNVPLGLLLYGAFCWPAEDLFSGSLQRVKTFSVAH